MLPFSAEEFFSVFERYNRAIWPVQLIAYGLVALMLWAIVTRRPWSWQLTAPIVGAFWLWNGFAYHLMFFAPINPAAYGFAALFIVQGIAFVASGRQSQGVSLTIEQDWRTALAWLCIAYATVIYGIIGALVGHGWPRTPMLGVAPCPTTIFTVRLLTLAGRTLSVWLASIPLVWALIGSTAAVLLGVVEDVGLLVFALAMLVFRFGWPNGRIDWQSTRP